MIKIGHIKEVNNIVKTIPKEVIEVVESIVTILDYEYGDTRNIDGSDGGYILIIESKEEFTKLKKIYLDINNLIPEYVDKIVTKEDDLWINALLLMNNDFAVSLIMREIIAPKILLEEME